LPLAPPEHPPPPLHHPGDPAGVPEPGARRRPLPAHLAGGERARVRPVRGLLDPGGQPRHGPPSGEDGRAPLQELPPLRAPPRPPRLRAAGAGAALTPDPDLARFLTEYGPKPLPGYMAPTDPPEYRLEESLCLQRGHCGPFLNRGVYDAFPDPRWHGMGE